MLVRKFVIGTNVMMKNNLVFSVRKKNNNFILSDKELSYEKTIFSLYNVE